jgi:hypothetical protein
LKVKTNLGGTILEETVGDTFKVDDGWEAQWWPVGSGNDR